MISLICNHFTDFSALYEILLDMICESSIYFHFHSLIWRIYISKYFRPYFGETFILFKMSDLFTNNSNPKGCYIDVNLPDRKFYFDMWNIINAIIGTCGNLLTLLAIPYAAKRKK